MEYSSAHNQILGFDALLRIDSVVLLIHKCELVKALFKIYKLFYIRYGEAVRERDGKWEG